MLNRLFGRAGKGASPKEKRAPWRGKRILEAAGSGERAEYDHASYPTVAVQWVSRAAGRALKPPRIPQQKTTVYLKATGFCAAGRRYLSLSQLEKQKGERGVFCRDCFGREVFCVRERFPCFDAEDFLHEDRCFRWFFLHEEGRLWRVFYADGTGRIYVTQDVRYLEADCWEKMKREGYLGE